jgi:hypothetical protein
VELPVAFCGPTTVSRSHGLHLSRVIVVIERRHELEFHAAELAFEALMFWQE